MEEVLLVRKVDERKRLSERSVCWSFHLELIFEWF